ncbi:MFS transporter [Actinomyces sp.]|uniref:MFS transporter n=1 Tax=Actinomyces sp. TaxID=29317 RepID=UPI0026DD7132|nr:MFS transporter [Actinomyces sp.]MDO4899747.1 MFS transporter [Actinomyces sp.]
MPNSTHLDEEAAGAVRRAACASFIGNFIEWFDYASYGYLAVVIGEVFFPASDPNTRLLSAFAVFAMSFILRPIGAIVWGAWGDRKGRKWALSWSILIMSASTVLVGCLPGYDRIGIWAAIILLLARMAQGFSASGEYAGAATFLAEYAPPARRGIYVSLVPASTAAGLLVGSLSVSALFAALDHDSMLAWGWRVPFLVAGPLGLVGRYIRTHLEDSPAYTQLRSRLDQAKAAASGQSAGTPSSVIEPLRKLLRHHRGAVLTGFGISCLNAVAFYLLLSYMPSFVSTELGFPETQATLATSVTLAVYIALIMVMGHVSDLLGRRRIMIIASVAFVIGTVPVFHVMTHASLLALIGCELLFALMLTLNDGTLASFLAELFPTDVRYSGFALSFNMANTLLGGTSPFIATWLIKVTGTPIAPAYLLTAVAALALASLLASRVRLRTDLKADPADDDAA